MSQLGLSLFLIIYTASIPTRRRRLPRYVLRAPSLSRLQLGEESRGGFFRRNMRPLQSPKTVREAPCRSNFRPFIKVLLLSFFIRSLSPLLPLFLSFFLSPFLSFFHSKSVPHNNTNGSVIALTYGRGGDGDDDSGGGGGLLRVRCFQYQLFVVGLDSRGVVTHLSGLWRRHCMMTKFSL